MRRRANQKYQRYDLIRVDDHYPWIRNADGSVAHHHEGVGERAIVVGSYYDQFGTSGARNKKIYTLLFEKHGRISWYDEEKLTMLDEDRRDLFETWNARDGDYEIA